jgi:single-stranded-DNA-specific exonuclease
LLPNMRAAVDRLFLARAAAERVVLFGDFDVDGVTSTTLLSEVLQRLGWTVSVYLPHRFEEGYGLSREGAENCLEKFPTRLLLAVDCGSTAVATIDWLRQQGVDVVVLDHHQISHPPPRATALVNPRFLPRDPAVPEHVSAPFQDLCSVGLAFKLAHALVKRGRELGLLAALGLDLRPWLDLVALGTIADLVPLTGENRILTTTGLERLNAPQRPGLQALRSVAQTDGRVGVGEVAFQLAPRLNAAGRLENAKAALDLLRARDLATAEPLARELDSRNRERQKIERAIAEEVIGAVRAKFNAQTDYVIVEGQLLWHIGVVGIVASRVVRAFHRPALILGGDGQDWRGSGRSIEGFDLAAALRDCSDLLLRHGGHSMAAGLTLRPEKMAALRDRLNILARQRLKPEQLQPTLRLDGEVTLGELTLERLEELALLGPNGMGNPPAQWMARRLRLQRPPQRMGKDQQHAKCWITDGVSTLEAVMWNAGASTLPEKTFDLAFEPQINVFNGRRSIQLRVLDWRTG